MEEGGLREQGGEVTWRRSDRVQTLQYWLPVKSRLQLELYSTIGIGIVFWICAGGWGDRGSGSGSGPVELMEGL